MTTETPPPRRRWRRAILRVLAALGTVLTLLLLAVVVDGWTAFGKAPEGERLARMKQSEHWADGVFVNPQPLWNDAWGMLADTLDRSDYTSPDEPLPVETVDVARFTTPPAPGLRVTWLGHSTLLVEIDGHRFLTDPIWGERTSPVSWLGPRRWYAPPLALDDLPPVEAVVLSHDHYDHLDYPTIAALADRVPLFVAPLGVGAHLEYWGVPADHIEEVDWWQERAFGDLRLVSVPARHASGRYLIDNDRTLWGGYAFIGPEHRALFTGDTGLFPGMTEIGERLGPFDITMIEVGAYGQAWPDWHLGPEQAVRAHRMMKGELMLPVHWGLFDLANHGWTEPIERVVVAAEAQGVRVATPRPGGTVDADVDVEVDRWWPEVPWLTVEQYPIEATLVD